MKELPVGGISHISGGWYALYSEWLRFCWNPSKTSIIAHVPLLSDFWYYWCQKKCATLILPLSFLVTHTYLYLYESNERMKHIHSNYLNFSFSITFFMILDFILFYFYFPVETVQSDWAWVAHREVPQASSLPDEDLCIWALQCEVSLLVFCQSAEKIKEN